MEIKIKIWKYNNTKKSLENSPLYEVNMMSLLNVHEHRVLYNLTTFENTVFLPEMFNSTTNKDNVEHILILVKNNKYGQIIGYAYATVNKDAKKICFVSDAIIQELYISKEYRYFNIGKRLIRHVCDYLRNHRHVQDIDVFVHKDNATAIKLYTKYNFVNKGNIGNTVILSKIYKERDNEI